MRWTGDDAVTKQIMARWISGQVVSKEDWGQLWTAYMRSPAWGAKRDACLAAANRRCGVKGCPRPADRAHHKTYANRFDEKPDDLMALCDPCHKNMSEPLQPPPPQGNNGKMFALTDLMSEKSDWIHTGDIMPIMEAKLVLGLPKGSQETSFTQLGIPVFRSDHHTIFTKRSAVERAKALMDQGKLDLKTRRPHQSNGHVTHGDIEAALTQFKATMIRELKEAMLEEWTNPSK